MQNYRKRLYLCSKKMMKRLFFIIFTILILSGCSRYNTPQEKFESLQNSDFSEFIDMGITSRPPVYIVRLHDTSYLVKKRFLSNKIKSITYYGNQNTNSVNFTKKDKKHLEHLLHLFDNLDVRALSVDKEGTVWFSFSCRDRCTYSYLKLSPTSSLEECGFPYYKQYNENWFYDVECSEYRRYREEKTELGPQDEIQTPLPYLLPIDSLWAYYDVAWTTSGRCNRPDVFDDDSSKNLSYGFYVVLDHRSGRTSNVADVVVSYRKNAFWGSSDTTQKIRIVHVKDKLFALPMASFHVGDPISSIKNKAVFKKGNYLCYAGEKYCYVVETSQDTIRHFFVFPSELKDDWTHLLKYVESH